MSSNNDDLDAVRTIVDALEPFDATDRDRIMRWVSEKLGLAAPSLVTHPAAPVVSTSSPAPTAQSLVASADSVGHTDLKTFVASKKPSSDAQFAAVIAYYYRFEAKEGEKKIAVGSEDLQNACRLASRDRLSNPGQTLRNACSRGLLDKADGKGEYAINTVGENLVAVTLPGAEDKPVRKRRTVKAKKPAAARKPAAKKKRPAKRKPK